MQGASWTTQGGAPSWVQVGAAAVFIVTFLLLALGRVGRLPIPRGATALAGGAVTWTLLAPFGAVEWRAWRLVDWQVMALLAGLMALAGLAEAAGLFFGVRRKLMRLSPAMALWTILVLVASTSALLLNDAAVVVLVPFLIPVVRAMGLPAVPSVVLMAVAANVGSLATPFGNPQNAVLARAAGLGLVDFLRVQGPLVLLGLILLGLAARVVVRKAPTGQDAAPHSASAPPASTLPASTLPALSLSSSTLSAPNFPPSSLAAPRPLVPRARPAVLVALVLFVAAAIASSWTGPVGLGGSALVAAGIAFIGTRARLGREADRAVLRGLDANVLALFAGLYLLTAGISAWMPPGLVPLVGLDSAAKAALATTALSNTVGNVPAILAFIGLDAAWVAGHASFLVATSTLGGSLLLTGSAASLIAADQARRHGIDVRFLPFARHAIPWTLPLLVVGAWWTWPG